MTARPVQSLRVRLVLGLSLTICLVWSGVAIWQFTNMQRELRTLLDDRLIASARMVVGIVQQFQQAELAAAPRASNDALLSVIGRDGVACEVSLVRSEVDILPIARTNNIPDMASAGSAGFGQITKGGKQWRTYVLEDKGVRVATADRLDVRDQLVQTFVRTLVLPFALALAGVLLLTWWISTRSLRPLRHLREELARRPPHDPTPVHAGRDTVELAPLVDSLNGLLARMDAAIAHERRWTMDAAHELRTPLTAIKTHVQVAQLVLDQAGPPAQAGDALRQAQEGIGHMHATLEQLLQLARLESASAPGSAEGAQGEAIVQAFALAVRQSCQRAAHEGRVVPAVAVQVLGNDIRRLNGVHGNGISAYNDVRDILIAGNVVVETLRPLTVHGTSSPVFAHGTPGVRVRNNIFVSTSADAAAVTSYGKTPQFELTGNFLSGPRFAMRLNGSEQGFSANGNTLVGGVNVADRTPLFDAGANVSLAVDGNGALLTQEKSSAVVAPAHCTA